MHLWQKLRGAACHRKGACKAHRYISVCAHGDDISGMSQLLCSLFKNPVRCRKRCTGECILHNKYINYLITELKPVTGEIIRQGAAEGLIVCQQPDALAEIVLLVLVVKLDNTLIPSTKEETEQTISELISLLEKGTDNPEGSLNFLKL